MMGQAKERRINLLAGSETRTWDALEAIVSPLFEWDSEFLNVIGSSNNVPSEEIFLWSSIPCRPLKPVWAMVFHPRALRQSSQSGMASVSLLMSTSPAKDCFRIEKKPQGAKEQNRTASGQVENNTNNYPFSRFFNEICGATIALSSLRGAQGFLCEFDILRGVFYVVIVGQWKMKSFCAVHRLIPFQSLPCHGTVCKLFAILPIFESSHFSYLLTWAFSGHPNGNDWLFEWTAPLMSRTDHSDLILIGFRLSPLATDRQMKRFLCHLCSDDWR